MPVFTQKRRFMPEFKYKPTPLMPFGNQKEPLARRALPETEVYRIRVFQEE